MYIHINVHVHVHVLANVWLYVTNRTFHWYMRMFKLLCLSNKSVYLGLCEFNMISLINPCFEISDMIIILLSNIRYHFFYELNMIYVHVHVHVYHMYMYMYVYHSSIHTVKFQT